MATQNNIPPDLTGSDIAAIVQQLDVTLNAGIFDSHLNGIYTGVVALMLWNIFTNKSRPIRWLTVIITILLYITTMINYAITTWSFLHSIFVVNAQTFWTEFQGGTDAGALILEAGIPSAICSILADAIMIWRCWTVWGQRSLIILVPFAFLVASMTCKILSLYKEYTSQGIFTALLPLLYSSFVLVTTLCCTLLIIFRIVTVARAAGDMGTKLGAYRHTLEILVESSALYSIALILYIVFDVQGSVLFSYFDSLAAFTRGIAPTLVMGRVAAGHARPDDSWKGSVMSSLHFGGHHEGSTTQTISHQRDSLPSAVFDSGLETQQERGIMSSPINSSQEEAILESVIQKDDPGV
ncbi:hypothetical protein IW261DRAFT_1593635 [Armillaria novae-zelandiae]|uniref:Uncharacterized protein n=1 Tax=Armillaria novae-zelandiae TaxID=153914 RepID=A0AA39P9P3_9AGAR|nr:hypothetical protein IW261DRAFT_1593635 [Armillaria novae-zelandiae]